MEGKYKNENKGTRKYIDQEPCNSFYNNLAKSIQVRMRLNGEYFIIYHHTMYKEPHTKLLLRFRHESF